jgi:hypothetical protein
VGERQVLLSCLPQVGLEVSLVDNKIAITGSNNKIAITGANNKISAACFTSLCAFTLGIVSVCST